MASSYCQKCGTPNQAGAQFCSKCGAPVAPATPPPPVTYQPAPPPAVVYAAPPPPPPKKSRKLLWIIIGVVVVIVVIVIVVISLAASSSVTVTAINFTSSDNACGANGHSESGFTTSGGGSVSYTLSVTNGNILLSCTISSVSATTSGFSISGANVPLTIPAGGTESLSFTITAPSGSYNGVLTIDIE